MAFDAGLVVAHHAVHGSDSNKGLPATEHQDNCLPAYAVAGVAAGQTMCCNAPNSEPVAVEKTTTGVLAGFWDTRKTMYCHGLHMVSAEHCALTTQFKTVVLQKQPMACGPPNYRRQTTLPAGCTVQPHNQLHCVLQAIHQLSLQRRITKLGHCRTELQAAVVQAAETQIRSPLQADGQHKQHQKHMRQHKVASGPLTHLGGQGRHDYNRSAPPCAVLCRAVQKPGPKLHPCYGVLCNDLRPTNSLAAKVCRQSNSQSHPKIHPTKQ